MLPEVVEAIDQTQTGILHALDRFVIHFFASAGVVLVCLFVFQFFIRKMRKRWNLFLLPTELTKQLFLVAGWVFAVSSLREAFDVKNGQPLYKAVTDYISWLGGCGCSVWGLVRMLKQYKAEK